MTGIKWVLLVLVLTFLSPARGDIQVSCVFNESCILPCSFPPGDEAVIHWYQITKEKPAHSYYYNQDQFGNQDQHFRGRTSQFQDQISRGNASLRLTGVEVQDQGRYKCYTSTTTSNKELFINLNVDAPVDKVNIQQVENRITCSSEGIYPQPDLTWSTSPPSNVSLENNPTVQQTEQLLYNITSSLIASVTDLVYSCSVSTRTNNRTATLFKLTSISVSDTETTIPCETSNSPLTGLVWRFNHSQIILNQTGANVPYTVSEEWRQQVKSVSESGSLTLKDFSSDQEGIYTCELSNAEETYVTNALLRIEKSQGNPTYYIIGSVLVLGAVIGLVWYCRRKRDQQRSNTEETQKSETGREPQGSEVEMKQLLNGEKTEPPKEKQQEQKVLNVQAAETDGAQDS